MLPRDSYNRDIILNLLPKTDFLAFQRDLFSPDRGSLYKFALEEEDRAKIEGISRSAVVSLLAAVTTMGLGLYFYDRIPLIRRAQRKWSRFFMKTFIVLFPFYIHSSYQDFKQVIMLEGMYQKYEPRYRAYKRSGDFRDLNPNIKLV